MSFSIDEIFGVQGKVVLVTGGGTGLGKAITAGFVQNGAKVYITGRRQEVLEATAKEIGGDIVPIKGDVSTKEGCKAIGEAFAAAEQKLDVLINCAGVMRPWKTGIRDHGNSDEVEKLLLDGHDDDDFDYSNSINVNGVYFMTAVLVPYLRQSADPSVVVIASIVGLTNLRAVGSVSYSVSKAATIHLGNVLAGYLHPMKIRVNTLCPGIFPSEMTGASEEGKGHEYSLGNLTSKAGKRSTAGRPGRPEEIVGPVLMLSSKAGGYFDGAMLTVDGGRLMGAGIHDGLRLPEDTYI